jgi:isopentenyl phosphate kinase
LRGAATLHKPLVVIKLGGSALTDKTRIYTPRIPIIHSAASQVAEIRKDCSVILIHGAGSYGHIPVKKYGLQQGWKRPKQLIGLSSTKFKLLEWENLLDGIFLEHGVPVMPFLASDLFVTEKGRIVSAWLKPLASWLRLGCVPITGGDIVPDSRNGFSILSGDQIAAFIAIKLKATRLIYAVDVDGVFNVNPALDSNAQLLETLTESSAAHLVSRAMLGTTPDVTGGMAGKINESLTATRHRIPVYFVNLTKSGRLRKAALGQKVSSSRLILR